MAKKKGAALDNADSFSAAARRLLDEGKPNSALGMLRLAVNEVLLATYWQHGILPRSQNRTVYLLRRNCAKLGSDALYKAFIRIYGVDVPAPVLKAKLPEARDELYSICAASWGESSRDFLEKAVDGELEWGYESSIVYVYEFCVHILQRRRIEEGYYDTAEFTNEYPHLAPYLGFDTLTADAVRTLLKLYENARGEVAG